MSRRVGSRIQLAVKRWIREGKKARLFKFRQDWAREFHEYECTGGPLDGLQRTCGIHSVVVAPGGYYEIDRGDCRLHYRTGARITSRQWSRE